MKKIKNLISVRIKIDIIQSLKDGMSVTEVSRKFLVSRQSIYKFKKRFEVFGIEGLESRSSMPKNKRSANANLIETVRVNCLKRPDLNASDLKQLIEMKVGVEISRATISRYLREKRLARPADRIKAIEVFCGGFVNKLNQHQFDFLTKHNYSYLDNMQLDRTNDLVLQIGYFSYRANSKVVINICACLNARTGFIALEVTKVLSGLVFYKLLKSASSLEKNQSIALCVVNKKKINFIASTNIYRELNDIHNIKITTFKNHSEFFEGGMFRRFKKSFNELLIKHPVVRETLLSGEMQEVEDLISVLKARWQKSPLNSYPTYGLSPIQMSSSL